MRSAVLLEQAAMIATTAYLISMLVARGVDLKVASAALGLWASERSADASCSWVRSDDSR